MKKYEIDEDKIIHPTKIYPNQEHERSFHHMETTYHLQIFMKGCLRKILPNFFIEFYKNLKKKLNT